MKTGPNLMHEAYLRLKWKCWIKRLNKSKLKRSTKRGKYLNSGHPISRTDGRSQSSNLVRNNQKFECDCNSRHQFHWQVSQRNITNRVQDFFFAFKATTNIRHTQFHYELREPYVAGRVKGGEWLHSCNFSGTEDQNTARTKKSVVVASTKMELITIEAGTVDKWTNGLVPACRLCKTHYNVLFRVLIASLSCKTNTMHKSMTIASESEPPWCIVETLQEKDDIWKNGSKPAETNQTKPKGKMSYLTGHYLESWERKAQMNGTKR